MRRLLLCLAVAAMSSLHGCKPADAAPVEYHFQIKGMHCESCVEAITNAAGTIDGVQSCKVSLEGESADCMISSPQAADAFMRKISAMGYTVSRDNNAADPPKAS